MAIARLNRKVLLKLFAPIAGITIGIMVHSFHNTLLTIIPGVTAFVVGTTFDWTGWLIMFILILLMIYRDGQPLVKNLQEEVRLGTITREQYLTACSANAPGWARLKAFLHSRYQTTNRFY